VRRRLTLSSASLLTANLAPLAGVLLLGWSVSSVVILYWFENVVIGVINIARMLAFSPAVGSLPAAFGASFARTGKPAAVMEGLGSRYVANGLKLFLIPFFAFHYFFFCAGHGVFVFHLFPDEDNFFGEISGVEPLGALYRAVEIFSTPLAFAAAVLAASHVISFLVNYLGGREYERTDLRRLMTMPYGRIVVLHLTIIFGGFATMALGGPLWVVVVLVVVKTGVDLRMHLTEHLDAGGARASEVEDVPADQGHLASRGRPVG
jgi:hypothetical protein